MNTQKVSEKGMTSDNYQGWKAEVGTRTFYLSPESQLRNLKEALPQPQFRNF
jgi:hypothetical protein